MHQTSGESWSTRRGKWYIRSVKEKDGVYGEVKVIHRIGGQSGSIWRGQWCIRFVEKVGVDGKVIHQISGEDGTRRVK